MDERIIEHLKYLNKYYLLLQETREVPLQTFERDPLQYGSAERFLQLAIESCLNIGNRIISLYQFEQPVSTPETYADIFKELEKIGLIDHEFSNRLIKMAKFRNRLVHLYWELEKELVYDIINENLDDFQLFQRKIVEFLKHHDL